MRLVQVADLLRCAGRDKGFDDIFHMRVVDARRELAVRERPGTSLAKLDIRLRIERPALPELRNIGMTRIDIVAAFKHERLHPGARERQRSEHAGRAEAHDDGPMFRRLPLQHLGRQGQRCLLHIAVAAQSLQDFALLLFPVREPDIEYIDELNGRAMVSPGVDSLTHNYPPGKLPRW